MSPRVHKFWSISLAIVFVGLLNLCACVTQCAASVPVKTVSSHACCDESNETSTPAREKHSSDGNCPHCESLKVEKSAPVRADAVDVSLHFLTLLPPLPSVLAPAPVVLKMPHTSPGDDPPAVAPRDLVHTGCQLTV